MSRFKKILIVLLILTVFFPVQKVSAQDSDLIPPTPAEVINAVNSLRLSYGLTPLAVHPVLMQIAQQEADGIASGYPGHWRPDGLTLGQWMISLGYPLSGDLSLDGYRSENWVTAMTAEQAINAWLGDDPHTNTMLSVERSDIGAGVAVGDDQIYVVIETALQTSSGRMQGDAYVILTSIPLTRMAYSEYATLAVENGTSSEYSIPVVVNTPSSNGDVYHEVQYGQTLWSIAVAYHTTIKDIQRLNNIRTTNIDVGQKLLVLRGATQISPLVATVATGNSGIPAVTMRPTEPVSPTYAVEDFSNDAGQNEEDTIYGVAAIALSAIFLGGIFTAMTRKKPL